MFVLAIIQCTSRPGSPSGWGGASTASSKVFPDAAGRAAHLAKSGNHAQVEQCLRGARPLVEDEPKTTPLGSAGEQGGHDGGGALGVALDRVARGDDLLGDQR